MVAKIESGKSMRGILHYNEDKVKAGKAELILASGFAADIENITLVQKLNRFRHLTELNGKVKTNALHLSLNFDASEKLTNARLQQIAAEYMERIGFGDQPFLVYRHNDSHHPHVHIATTNIQKNGQRIDIHGIGYRLSEPARKELEKKFGLVKAESREMQQQPELAQARYGERPTKQVISNIVTQVLREYAFGSFAEYKAILESFGILADRGAENTTMYQNKGLQYAIRGTDGQPTGVPIKASSIYGKPTLLNIEKRFEKNLQRKAALRQSVRQILDQILVRHSRLLPVQFGKELSQNGIVPVYRRSEQGLLYGISYVDRSNKAIFNGSELGKTYSAQAIAARLIQGTQHDQGIERTPKPVKAETLQQDPRTYLPAPEPTGFLEIALAQTYEENGIRLPKRKKRKKGQQQEKTNELSI